MIIEKGYCNCGCGGKTVIASESRKDMGWIKGEPKRYIHGHYTYFKTTHGMTKTVEYGVWRRMIKRCTSKGDIGYRLYGARGIKVCKRWMKFENFFEDMGKRPVGMSIDRIDNNKGYSLNNCRWATKQEQNRNTRRSIKYKGENAVDASARLGGCKGAVISRIKYGWSLERAFTEPLDNNHAQRVRRLESLDKHKNI